MVVIGLLIGLIACIIPIAIVILIITAIVKRNKEDKTGSFGETIRNVYVYIILIVTLIAIIAGVIEVFRTGLDVILPEKATYESSYSSEQIDKNENIIELATTISLVVSVIPVYIYHNKLAKKSRETKIQETNN